MEFDPTRPIYLQIMEEVKKRAVRGDYSVGEQLPSVRDMASQMLTAFLRTTPRRGSVALGPRR